MMDTFWQDLRYGLRMLAKSPVFTAVAVLTLALGIGANTAIFSVINAVLLRPLPVQNPRELVIVYCNSPKSGPNLPCSYPDYADFRDGNDVFSNLVAYSTAPLSLDLGENSEALLGEIVSGNYFQALGVRAALGRTFLPEEDKTPGAHPVAVLSHRTWQSRFGADPGVVGQPLRLNGTSFTVIGVAPEGFTGSVRGIATELWVPLMMQTAVLRDKDRLNLRSSHWLFVVGRLRPGVSLAQAQAGFDTLATQFEQAYPETNKGYTTSLLPFTQVKFHPQVDAALLGVSGLLLGVVGLVLLIACANVANLLLARATTRRKEIAVRLSLGASRWRLVRQLLTEGLLLAALGGVVGLLFSLWAAEAALAALTTSFRHALPVKLALDLTPDVRVLGFTFVVSLLTVLAFAFLPALQASKPDLAKTLKDTSGTVTGGLRRARLRQALVVVQVVSSVVLLIAAGLFLRSLQNASTIDPGFQPENVVVASLNPTAHGYEPEQAKTFYRQLTERLEAVPGVDSASLASHLPLSLYIRTEGVAPEGQEPGPEENWPEIDVANVGPRYFETLYIALLRGRDFSDEDNDASPPVAIVNETLAQRFWPNQEALGRHLLMEGADDRSFEVVGVVRNGKYRTLGEAPRPYLYIPVAQHLDDLRLTGATLIARTARQPSDALKAIRQEVAALDATLPVTNLQSMGESIGISLLLPRAGAALFAAFGFFGLVLASIGIYGVISYAVSQRTHEIGIRMALGAQPRDVLKLVVGQGLLLTLLGVGIGLLAAFGVTRFLSSLLYGISPADPLTFAAISLLLSVVALLACYLPARRAARVDPMVALRYE